MNNANIELTSEDGVTILRVTRPPVNGIDLELALALERTFTELDSRGTALVPVVFMGLDHCFSAGLDLKAVPTYSAAQQRDMVRAVNRLFRVVYGLPTPTVAAIGGHAIAGGLVLALACDYRVARRGHGKFGLTEVRVGVPFPVAALAVTKAELSPGVARRLVLGGETLDTEAALRDGIVDELVDESPLARAKAVARAWGEAPGETYARVKRQHRAEVLDALDGALRDGDPMLRAWIS